MALALARVVLQAPPWVVFDDTFSSMEDETLERVIDMFTHELKTTTIIHIGRARRCICRCSRACCILRKAPERGRPARKEG